MGERVLVFEQHATIDVSVLRKVKLFQSNKNKTVTLKHYMPYQVTWLREQSQLKIEFLIGGKYFCQFVSVSSARANFGARFFFECPITRRRCSTLHLAGTQFVSRAATRGLSVRAGSPAQREQQKLARARNRLFGRDGKKPARGRNRAALIETLKAKSRGYEAWSSEVADQALRLNDQIERMARRTPTDVKTGPMSTRAGLHGPYETKFAVLTRGLDAVRTAGPGPQWQRPKEVQRVEETAAIDLSTLTKAMKVSWGEVGSHCLLWDQRNSSIQIVVTVDLRPEHNPGMHIQNLMGSGIPRGGQTVQIVRSANGRMRFICPVTGRRADTFFIRDGLVASRQALHLDYFSQIRGRNATRRKNASVKRNLENQKRLFELLHKYEMASARMPTPTPTPTPAPAPTPEQRKVTQMFIRVAQVRYRKALAGHTSSMISYLLEQGWGRPHIEIPEVMTGYERDEFLASLADASSNAPGLSEGSEASGNWL